MATATTLYRLLKLNVRYVADGWDARLPRFPVLRGICCFLNMLLVPVFVPLRYGYWKLIGRI